MEEQKFKVIIVEDVKLELKGTEEIFRHEIPNAEVIGTAMTESEFWPLMEAQLPDLVLLDLGLGGSTTIGVDICRNIFSTGVTFDAIGCINDLMPLLTVSRGDGESLYEYADTE